MSHTVWRWGTLLLLLVSLPALACNLFSGDDGTADQDASLDVTVDALIEEATAPVQLPGAEAPDGPSFGGLSSVEDALGQFESYRTRMDMTFEDLSGSSASGSMTMFTSRTIDPPASQVEVSFSGGFAEDDDVDVADGATVTYVVVEGTDYTIIPGFGCVSGMGATAIMDDFDTGLDVDELVNVIENPNFVGEETVNGIVTDHYRFDESHLRDQSQQLEQVRGDLYVSQEHGHLVRMVMDAVGDLDDDADESRGNIHMVMDVLDVGVPFTIELPAECSSTGLDVPIMEGASGVNSFAGFTSYSVQSTLAEAIAFYEQEMAARGYRADSDALVTESFATMSFSAEGQPTVSVTFNADGGMVTILITGDDNS